MRQDYSTLTEELGFTDQELRELGLLDELGDAPSSMADAYVRRSKKSEDVASLRNHVRDIVHRCKSLNLGIRHVWFEQLSASKKRVQRREYAKAIQAVLDGNSKVLAVWKLDRFDRKGAGSVMTAIDRLDERKCRLITVKEGLDSGVKGSRMLFSIFAERAKDEADDISTRVTNGHDAHKALGRRGTGVPPFGVASERGSGTVYPHPTEYTPARRIAEMMLGGMTTVEAAYEANKRGFKTRNGNTFSSTTVAKLVQSPLFAGMVPKRERMQDEYGNELDSWAGYGDPVYDDDGNPLMCGEGVISPAEFFAIREKIRSRTNPFQQQGKRLGTYLLSESLKCPRCFGSSHGGGGKYHCATRDTRGPAVCAGFVTTSDRIDEYATKMWVGYVNAMEPDSDELMAVAERMLRITDPGKYERRVAAQVQLGDALNRRSELEDRYWNPKPGMPRMAAETYERQLARLTETIETMERITGAETVATDVTVLLEPDSLLMMFESNDLATKRALLKAVWPHGISITPAKGRGDHTPLSERVFILTSARKPTAR